MTQPRLLLVLVTTLFNLHAPAYADPIAFLRPAEILASLETTYPPVVVALAEKEAAQAALMAAAGAFDPAWKTRAAARPSSQYPHQRIDSNLEQATPWWGTTFFGGWRRGDGNFAPYDGKLATNDGGEWRAGLTVPLWRNGPIDRRRAELVRAEAQTTIAEASLRLQRLEASQQAIQRYWDWVAAGQQVAIARRWLNLARKRDADLATGIRTGALPALDRQENERAIQQREGYLAQAERGLERSAIALSLFLRDEKGSPRLPSPGQLPPTLPPARHLSEALVQADLSAVAALRPEPRQVEAQLEQARVDLALAENQLAPAFDLSFQGSQDLGAGQVGRATPELEAGVLVDVPLIARTPRGKIAQSQAKVKGLEAKLRFAQDKARAGVKDAVSAVVAATRRAVAAQGEREVAERLAVLEAERLRLGEGSLFIVNLREQAAADAAVREAIALGEHQRARVVYETSAGRIPTGDTPQQDG